jgi:hypothetical protein
MRECDDRNESCMTLCLIVTSSICVGHSSCHFMMTSFGIGMKA